MENFYTLVLAWSIKKLVNRQKTYQARCDKLNHIINSLIDLYACYSRGIDYDFKKGRRDV